MKKYIILSCEMLNEDSRRFGTAFFYCEDEKGSATDQDIEEIRRSGNNDIWEQTWLVQCADRMEVLSKKRLFMEAQGQPIG